jgi:DNA-binding winged helix-turn-helix (wHTH) protein
LKLLHLLASRAGEVVTREEIRTLLWGTETFVDFEQGVNFAVKQVREALDDAAERSFYIQTVPKRGYRFVAPVEGVPAGARADTGELQKAVWENIVELRLAEERRRKRVKILTVAAVVVALVLTALLVMRAV